MEAKKPTPMGATFELATRFLENKTLLPSRSYHPNLILISDGQPTDERGRISDNWKEPLEQLLNSDRASKALRFAMGIGPDADEETLKAFLIGQDPEFRYFGPTKLKFKNFSAGSQ